jgi:hypothetical protein
MRIINYFFIPSMIILAACNKQESRTEVNRLPDTLHPANNETSKNSLTIIKPDTIQPSVSPSGRLEKWKSLDKVHRNYTMVQRDNQGYLIYQPGNDIIPTIQLTGGYVTIRMNKSDSLKLSIDKFTREEGNKSFFIYAADKNVEGEFIARIVDPIRKLVLWKFYIDNRKNNGEKKIYTWLMIPGDYKKELRQVIMPKGTDAKTNFLPIEFK